MASPIAHLGSSLPFPAELLQEICKNLDRPDLKTCRLVSHDFSYAAEISLFRHILLKRNVESFMRLRLIAGHPRFSQLVKSLCYSGMVLDKYEVCSDFENWSADVVQGGEWMNFGDALLRHSKSLTPEQLQVHYQKYCAHYHSETLMDEYDIETQDLTDAIGRMPRLDQICFDEGENYFNFCIDDPMSFDQMTSIGREILQEPCSWAGSEIHEGQIFALLRAAHTFRRQPSTLKALGIPWDFFQDSETVLAILIPTIRDCRYLAFNFVAQASSQIPLHDSTDGKANLARTLSGAPFLCTLELSFGFFTKDPRFIFIKLAQIITPGAHWPSLRRLKLHHLESTDVELMGLLTSHAASLKFLDLGTIRLARYQVDGKEFHGSWVEMILFLQTFLHLKSVHLGGFLINEFDEAWSLWDPDKPTHNLKVHERPKSGSCLKHRIERFIVEGGTCPLPMPHEAQASGGWDSIDFGGDSSWAHDPELLQIR